MGERERHFRVVSEINGRFLIQEPHFKSEADARAYITANANVIVPHEVTRVVEDSDSRVYPVWRANRPSTSSTSTP